jgi:hypothetical protein
MVSGGKFTTRYTFLDRNGTKTSVRVVVDQAALDALIATKTSPVGKYLYKRAKEAERIDKAAAPVSAKGSHGRPPGYLRSRIGTFLSQDADGPYADVVTRARSKAAKGKRAIIGPLQKGQRRRVATSQAAYYGRIQNQKGRHKGYMETGLRGMGRSK